MQYNGTVAPMGWNLARSSGPLLRAKFHPHRCKDKGIGPPKLMSLLIFDQNVEYKRPAGRIPCTIFTTFAEFVPSFRMRISYLSFVGFTQGVMELWEF